MSLAFGPDVCSGCWCKHDDSFLTTLQPSVKRVRT